MTSTTSVHEVAADVLGADAAEFATLSFLHLGGDSLRAMRLAAVAEELLGVRIPVAALLSETPLADVLAEAGAGPPAAPAAVAERPAGSVTHAQRGMWMVERITGGSPYNLVFSCLLTDGRLDAAALRRAVQDTVSRHPGLRTVYAERDGAVTADVRPDGTAGFEVVWDDGRLAGFADRVRELAARHGQEPFDVSAAPAVRFTVVDTAAGPRALVLMAHHMVLDGWSVGLVLTELLTRHDALVRDLPDLYGDVPGGSPRLLVKQQEADRAAGVWDRQAELWAAELSGVPTVLELPADRPRPAVQDPAGGRVPLDLGVATSAAVRRRSRELGVTPFAFLLGAYALALARWTGRRRLLVGVPLTGRTSTELESLVAVAGNLVPVPVHVDDDVTVPHFLRDVHHSLGRGIDAGRLPFEELVARLGIERGPGWHPLVQASFGMHDQLVPQRIVTPTATVRVEEGHGGGAQFDLSLLLGRSDPSFAGHLEHATALWDAAEAGRFAGGFAAAADGLAAAGDGPLAGVRCLSAPALAQLAGLNDTRRDLPATSVDALVRQAATRTPDAVAVAAGGVALTYRELLAAAAEQAGRLRAAGVRPGDRVLIGVDRSVAEVVALLGTLWVGAAYVGIDLTQPAGPVRAIVAAARPVAVVGAPIGDLPQVPVWEPSWTGLAGPVPAAPADPARPAYVAFTSGSTGRPKGVVVPHRAVVRLVHEPGFVRLGPGERMLRLSPLAFDASTLELWGPLAAGAAIEVHPAGLVSPGELGSFLVERRVTVAWLTAGLFRLVAEFAADSVGGLRQLLTGGDVVPHEHAARLLRRHPGLVVTNGYGPTENTTFTTTYSVADAARVDGPLPIGTPLPGTRVYVLDDRGRLIPPGAAGELYAAGAGLADGYLGDSAATARAFGPFSPDVAERLYRTGDLVRLDTRGRLRYLGRTDDQVKLRGYRVELTAIADALRALPQVQDAVVAVTAGDSADKRLVAGVVPAPGEPPDVAVLRAGLAATLPSYMVPALWAVLDRMPVTPNGKVDRRALAAAARPVGAGGPTPAADPLLDRVTALFAEAAGGPAAGPDADFFVAGGNSMGALRLVRLIRDRLGVTVALRDFLRDPTPSGLRRLVGGAGVG